VVEEAQGIELASKLIANGVSLVLYDPAAMENARLALSEAAIFASSMEECARQVDVVVITTPWNEFKALSPQHLNYSNGRPTVVDCWRILPREEYESSVNYVALGRGPQRDQVPLYIGTATNADQLGN